MKKIIKKIVIYFLINIKLPIFIYLYIAFVRKKLLSIYQWIYVIKYTNNKFSLKHNVKNIKTKVHIILTLYHPSGGLTHSINIKIKQNPNIYFIVLYSKKTLVNVKGYFNNEIIDYGDNLDPIKTMNILIAHYKIDLISIQSLSGYNFNKMINYLCKQKIALEVALHDFFYICPSIFLINNKGKFCNVPDNVNTCKKCITFQFATMPFSNIAKRDSIQDINVNSRRQNVQKLFDKADKLIAYSNSTINLYKKAFYINEENIIISDDLLLCSKDFITLPKNYNPFSFEKIKIAMVGSWADVKGSDVFSKMQNIIEKDNNLSSKISLVFIGNGENIDKKIINIGSYNSQTLSNIIIRNEVSVCIIPSICNETFSITTQDCINVGIPIVVFGIGAMKERVVNYNKGLIINDINEESVAILSNLQIAEIAVTKIIKWLEIIK